MTFRGTDPAVCSTEVLVLAEGGRKLNVQQGNSLNWFLHTCYSSSCFVSGLNWGQSVMTIFF